MPRPVLTPKRRALFQEALQGQPPWVDMGWLPPEQPLRRYLPPPGRLFQDVDLFYFSDKYVVITPAAGGETAFSVLGVRTDSALSCVQLLTRGENPPMWAFGGPEMSVEMLEGSVQLATNLEEMGAPVVSVVWLYLPLSATWLLLLLMPVAHLSAEEVSCIYQKIAEAHKALGSGEVIPLMHIAFEPAAMLEDTNDL